MLSSHVKTIATAIAVSFFFAFGLPVQASEVLNPPIKVAKKKKSKKSGEGNGSSASFKPGSQETKKERSARLTRECKDQVNAGACSGYTR